MKRLVFTTFFTYFLLFLIIPNVLGEYSIGVQPSIIELNLNPKFDQITLPYRLWNQGSETINITLIPINISQFTNFTTINVTLKANTSRIENYLTVPVVFKMTTENISTEGGILIRPIPPNDAMSGTGARLITEVYARIKIIQTDTNTNRPAYSFPVNTTNSSSTTTPSSNSNPSSNTIINSIQNFFIQNKTTVGIAVIIILLLIGLILAYKYIFKGL